MHRFILIFFALYCTTLLGQDLTIEKIGELPLEADRFIAVDKFNALYYIRNNILFKKDDRMLHQFSALQLGELSSVDIVNPLRITLFYESSNTALILDNTLSEIARINFSTIENFRNVSHVTTASDRRFWIYNTDLQQLEIFDWNMEKVITQFPPMKQNALALASNFNFAWVSTEESLFYYNNYGSFLDKMAIKQISHLAQDKGAVLAFAKAELYYKNKQDSSFSKVVIPDLNIQQLSLTGEIIYIYSNQKLTSFRLSTTQKNP